LIGAGTGVGFGFGFGDVVVFGFGRQHLWPLPLGHKPDLTIPWQFSGFTHLPPWLVHWLIGAGTGVGVGFGIGIGFIIGNVVVFGLGIQHLWPLPLGHKPDLTIPTQLLGFTHLPPWLVHFWSVVTGTGVGFGFGDVVVFGRQHLWPLPLGHKPDLTIPWQFSGFIHLPPRMVHCIGAGTGVGVGFGIGVDDCTWVNGTLINDTEVDDCTWVNGTLINDTGVDDDFCFDTVVVIGFNGVVVFDLGRQHLILLEAFGHKPDLMTPTQSFGFIHLPPWVVHLLPSLEDVGVNIDVGFGLGTGDEVEFAISVVDDFGTGDGAEFAISVVDDFGTGDGAEFAISVVDDFGTGDGAEFATGIVDGFGTGDGVEFATGVVDGFGTGDGVELAIGVEVGFGVGVGVGIGVVVDILDGEGTGSGLGIQHL